MTLLVVFIGVILLIWGVLWLLRLSDMRWTCTFVELCTPFWLLLGGALLIVIMVSDWY